MTAPFPDNRLLPCYRNGSGKSLAVFVQHPLQPALFLLGEAKHLREPSGKTWLYGLLAFANLVLIRFPAPRNVLEGAPPQGAPSK